MTSKCEFCGGDCGRVCRGLGFKNTPEASGTARKAPSGSLLGDPSRNSVRASSIPERKQPEAKPTKPADVPASDGVVSRRATPRSVATTSENRDVTAGETAPKFDRAEYHRNYMREYMRKRRQAEKRK